MSFCSKNIPHSGGLPGIKAYMNYAFNSDPSYHDISSLGVHYRTSYSGTVVLKHDADNVYKIVIFMLLVHMGLFYHLDPHFSLTS